MRLRLFAAIGLSCAGLAAQTLTPSLPRVFAGWDAPGSNWLPLGRTRSLLQTWYHGSNLRGPATLREIGWRIDAKALARKKRQRLEIVLGNTKRTAATLAAKFTSNLGQASTVLPLTWIDFPAISKAPNPNRPALWIKARRPFVFSGPHLIVQTRVETTTTFDFVQGYLVDSVVSNRGQTIHGRTGIRCGRGKLSATATRTTWNLVMSGLPPQAPAFVVVGIDHVRLGAIPLPLDLTALGMPGCRLYVEPLFLLGFAADATGVARVQLPFKASAAPIAVHAQGLELDPKRPTGLASSNAVHSLLTDRGLAAYLYNWGRDGSVAEFGPFAENTGQILLWR